MPSSLQLGTVSSCSQLGPLHPVPFSPPVSLPQRDSASQPHGNDRPTAPLLCSGAPAPRSLLNGPCHPGRGLGNGAESGRSSSGWEASRGPRARTPVLGSAFRRGGPRPGRAAVCGRASDRALHAVPRPTPSSPTGAAVLLPLRAWELRGSSRQVHWGRATDLEVGWGRLVEHPLWFPRPSVTQCVTSDKVDTRRCGHGLLDACREDVHSGTPTGLQEAAHPATGTGPARCVSGLVEERVAAWFLSFPRGGPSGAGHTPAAPRTEESRKSRATPREPLPRRAPSTDSRGGQVAGHRGARAVGPPRDHPGQTGPR